VETETAAARTGSLIMGVDDDAVNMRLIREIVEVMGHTFLGATNGADALRLLYRVSPKLILLDVMMPEMDGYEACRRIRQEFPLLRAPIIFLTALNSPEDVARGLGAQGNDYVIKPFTPDRLRQRITHWLRVGVPVEEDA
jgi:CheY-like chemotaxis protein